MLLIIVIILAVLYICFEVVKLVFWFEHKHITLKQNPDSVSVTYVEVYKMLSNYEGLWELTDKGSIQCLIGTPSSINKDLIVIDGKEYLMSDPQEYSAYVKFYKNFIALLEKKEGG